MLDLDALDLDEIATALSDQTDYEYRWLIDPRTGDIAFWTFDTGIDGENPIELDELDLIPIGPLASRVWYADMADFAEQVSDAAARQRLARALSGRGAFRRFQNELYEEYPDLVSVWQVFRDARAQRVEQSDGFSTKDSSPKLLPRASVRATLIPTYPEGTAVSPARALVPHADSTSTSSTASPSDAGSLGVACGGSRGEVRAAPDVPGGRRDAD